MDHFVYIIYSIRLDKFYVGESSDVNQRLTWHNTHEFINSFTSKAEDWQLRWCLKCKSISQARKIETFIKRMKSRKFIERLIISDPEWLLKKIS